MFCKDCLHYEACKGTYFTVKKMITKDDFDNEHYADVYNCPDFTARSECVWLPCVAMVEQFIKDGKFDRRKTAHNGRIAVVYIDKKKWNSPLIDITEQFYNTDKAQERIKALEGMKEDG